jgi:cbb3-type cytochrome oxidase subunit 1/plastocyanin
VTATLVQETAAPEVSETGGSAGETPELESSRGDLAARLYFSFSGLFFLATCAAGLLWAASVMSPAVVGLSEANAQVAPHGNLLPVLWNIAVYGWLSSAAFGAVLYVVPRLTGAPLRFPTLLVLNSLGWAALVGVGALAVSAGFGRPLWLLEYPPVIHVAMAGSALVVLGAVLLSVMGRLEPRLYPSLWYFVAGLLWLAAALVLGALPLYAGIGQAIQSAFVAQCVIGLWLFVTAAGTAYYVIPKASSSPLYSVRLAQLSLWGFALFWVFTGGVRLVFSPTSGAYQSTSIAFAIAATVPLLATVANLTKGLKGLWSQLAESSVLRWMTAGIVALAVYSVVMPLSVLRSINQITGLTGASVGVDRLLLFGVVGAWLIGSVYFALPRISGRQWAYPRLVDTHLGLFVAGIAIVVTAEIVGGAVQGFVANSGAGRAFPVSYGEAWQAVAGPQRWFAGMAAVGWAALAISAVLAVSNAIRSLVGGRPGLVETVSMPQELVGIREQVEIVPEEARRRVIEPIALPLLSTVGVVVIVYSASRILIAVQRFGSKTAATALALVIAGVILGASALIAAFPKVKSGFLTAVLVIALGAVIGGGALAQSKLNAASEPAATPESPQASVTISLVAQNIAFDKDRIEAPAGVVVSIDFENKDSVDHNFALYQDEQMKTPIFQGTIISKGSTTYTFTTPSQPGSYFFFCDVHPIMKGTFQVVGSG